MITYRVLYSVRPHQGEEYEKSDAEKNIIPDAYFLNLFHIGAKIRISRVLTSSQG